MGMCGNRSIRGGHQQSPRHPQVHNPLCIWLTDTLIQRAAACNAQLADNVFSGAMYRQNRASLQPFGLARRVRLERLRMPAEPYLDNAVSAHTFMHSASNRLNLGQFRHRSIVREFL